MIRKIRRNMIKKQNSSNNFSGVWAKYQQDKYGGKYKTICLKNVCYK